MQPGGCTFSFRTHKKRAALNWTYASRAARSVFTIRIFFCPVKGHFVQKSFPQGKAELSGSWFARKPSVQFLCSEGVAFGHALFPVPRPVIEYGHFLHIRLILGRFRYFGRQFP